MGTRAVSFARSSIFRSLSRYSRRETLVKMLIFSNILILVGLHVYISHAQPLSLGSLEISSRSAISSPVSKLEVDHDSFNADRSRLQNFVDSASNKQVFSQLQYFQSAFFDPDYNNVGTIEYPKFNQYQRQPYVSNGYIGSRIPNLGQGFTYDQLSDAPTANDDELLNGWPLFNKRYSGAFVAGFYDIQDNVTATNFPELLQDGYESIIAAIPQWSSLQLRVEKDGSNYTLDPSLSSDKIGKISNYAQNLSLSDGIVTTQFTWLDQIQVQLQVAAHRSLINNGVVSLQLANLDASSSINIDITDILDFDSAQRSQLTQVNHDDSGIYITFQPHQIDYIDGAIYSKLFTSAPISREVRNGNSVSQSISLTLDPKKTAEIGKLVGIFTTDYDPSNLNSTDDVLQAAKSAVIDCKDNIGGLIQSHKIAWDQTLESTLSITFPDDPLLTMAARASVFHLTSNTRPDAKGVTAALGVSGLSSDSYGGMVFWDTDLWILNGLLPFIPQHAKSLINYRLHTHQQAIDNLPYDYHNGAVYPWTSGRFGNCTSTGPCMDYEYHINFAVAQAAWGLYLSGAADDTFLEETAYPLINDAALFLADYVKYNDTLQQYTTHNLTDPDEYANHVDNGAYTNAAISLTMRWAIALANHLNKPFPSQFSNIVGSIHMPTSDTADNITLEYTGMNSSVGIKQADVIMVTYPLDNELIDKDQALTNMDFYAMKQVSYGPAMTFPIFSIVSSLLSNTGCSSSSYLHKGVTPFLRAPFAQYSEQNQDDFLTNGGTHPAFPFLTAHGGFLQAILQGLTGLKYDFETDALSGKLKRVIRFDPAAVPCLGEGVQFDGIKYMNQSLFLKLDEKSFTIKNNGPINDEGKSIKSIDIRIGDRNPKSGHYSLARDEELVIPLFKTESSFPKSFSECASATFTNITDSAFGDLPNSMNDGDNTTHWEARYNDTTAKVLIDLKEVRNVTQGLINWGDKPPKEWSLFGIETKKLQSLKFLEDTVDILTFVDFGNKLHQYFKYNKKDGDVVPQKDVFTLLLNDEVEINAPFDPEEYTRIEVPSRHNTSSFEFDQGFSSRFFLLELKGIHNEMPIEDDIGGAKIFEVNLQ